LRQFGANASLNLSPQRFKVVYGALHNLKFIEDNHLKFHYTLAHISLGTPIKMNPAREMGNFYLENWNLMNFSNHQNSLKTVLEICNFTGGACVDYIQVTFPIFGNFLKIVQSRIVKTARVLARAF
jgi:hypothetical protein